jgi:D-alanyl-D-alanine carboxypeptidase (penicillin-binding protein 5/6)
MLINLNKKNAFQLFTFCSIVKLQLLKGIMNKYSVFFLGVIFSQVVFAKQLEIDLSAKSAILINNKTGKVLYAKDPECNAYPASVTKIATALYTIDRQNCDLNQYMLATPEALATISAQKKSKNNYTAYPSYYLEIGGSGIDIKRGEKLSLQDLLYGMMLSSGNDAANVIAENFGPSIPRFMENLNAYLKLLGCKNTHFVNPHGLHHPEHITCAYDLALMTRKAMQNPLFQKIVSTTHYRSSLTNKQKPKDFYQTNRLLKKGKYYYPFAVGVKTGYTSFSGHNLVACAVQNDRSLTAVLLGYENSPDRFSDAKLLFEKAFSEERISKKIISAKKRFMIAVSGADRQVSAKMDKDFILQFYPSEEEPYKVFVHWTNINLPINKNSIVGQIEVKNLNGEILASEPLVADKNVGKSLLLRLKEYLFN